MSLVIPQVYIAPNWKLRDHEWMRRKNVAWVLKYVDKNPPRMEELSDEEEAATLQDKDYPTCTVLCFDHLENEQAATTQPNGTVIPPCGLLNHLPQAIGFLLMTKHLVRNDPDISIVISSPKGTSRAPAVLAASIILTRKSPAEAAVGHVMSQHNPTNISQQLLTQLGVFEKTMAVDEQKAGFTKLMVNHIDALAARLKISTQKVNDEPEGKE